MTDDAAGAAELAGVIVSRETLQRLNTFVDLLRRWNTKINLVARSDNAVIWRRHIADSLQLLLFVQAGCRRGIDLGSGAGFPGLILSLATQIPFALIESDARKAAFLREAARETKTPATVIVSRIEAAAVEPTQLLTARALAPLSALLGLAAPLLAPGGVCLFPKGVSAGEELTASAATWNMHVERHQSRIDPQGCILRISEVSRV